MELTCPKCQAPMRSYERSGVTVDQCTECRGIFLDRGELERLVDADTRYHGDDRSAQPAPKAAPGYPVQPPPQQSYGGQPYQQHHGQKPHKKRKSFFEEIFD
jgi:uncharacterized protein